MQCEDTKQGLYFYFKVNIKSLLKVSFFMHGIKLTIYKWLSILLGKLI